MSGQTQSNRVFRAAAVLLAATSLGLLTTVPASTASAASGTSASSVSGCPTPQRQPTRQGNILGIVSPGPVARIGAACATPALPASSSFNGTPPLLYHGGPLMGSAATVGEVTVTPIYWAPSGYGFPSTYQSIINSYISNVAADSGRATNVFSAATQYTNATSQHINYKIHAGTPLPDTDLFPFGGCTPDTGAIYPDNSGYSACLTDAQLRAELQSFLTANSLPNDLAHLYVVFLPKGAESCVNGLNGSQNGTCSLNPSSPTVGGFCGYHSSTGLAIYASMPFSIHNSPTNFTCSAEVNGGPGNQSPNGNLDADAEISTLSHEVVESITDPLGTGWYDSSGLGGEIGDECNFVYGSGFGGSNGTFFNQTINGSHYFTQEEFSNEDFHTISANSCIQQEAPAASFVVTTSSPVAHSPVAFDGTASSDTDRAAGITSYSWNFGDASPSGTGATPNHTYPSGGTYTVTLTVSDVDGLQGTISHSVVVAGVGAPYTPVSPTRICDTRPTQPGVAANQCNTGVGAGPLGPGGSRNINVAGQFAVPADATAAVFNVTVANTTSASFLTLWPAGLGRPNASNLNWAAGTTIPNLVEVSLGSGGQVGLFNALGSADVLIDLEGYVQSASTSLYNPLTPARICDTRAAQPGVAANQCNTGAGGGTVGPAGSLKVTIAGNGGVPAVGVTAVVLNVTAADTTAPSFLAVWPDLVGIPNASNLNWLAGETIANRVIAPVGTDGKIEVYNSAGSTDVLADVSGYFTASGGASYTPLVPARICDSRPAQPGVAANQCNNNGVAAGTLGPADSKAVQVTDGTTVPIGATAAVLNVTVTDTTSSSFLTAWPDMTVRPNASDLNWSAGTSIPNLVVVKLGPGGKIDLFNSLGTTDIIADIEGYYS